VSARKKPVHRGLSTREFRCVSRFDEAERGALRIITGGYAGSVAELEGADDQAAVGAHSSDGVVEGRDGEEEEPVGVNFRAAPDVGKDADGGGVCR